MTYAPQEAGFYYGTSKGSLTKEVYYDGTITTASGSFSASVMSLSSGTTYYYQAFMSVWTGSKYETILGDVKNFSTTEPVNVGKGYLNCLEVPAVAFDNTGGSGAEDSGRGYKWYRYNTTNAKRAVVTHTYQDGNKVIRNYTVMLDGDKKAPVWTAHAMHAEMWPDNNEGRNNNWNKDPAFEDSWQQTGVSGGYSKGHLVASNYRQSSSEQNKQTFYYSNQAPQWQNGFNGGIWSTLEGKVKSASPTGRDTLYVVTGTLYEGTARYQDDIQLPSHFYKCVMKCSFDASGTMTAAQGVAYVFTNESHTGAQLDSFKTTIDAIETRAGFDFFPRVPSNLQTAAENGSSPLSLE